MVAWNISEALYPPCRENQYFLIDKKNSDRRTKENFDLPFQKYFLLHTIPTLERDFILSHSCMRPLLGTNEHTHKEDCDVEVFLREEITVQELKK